MTDEKYGVPKTTITDDNILEIPADVKAGLIKYAEAERKRFKNPLIRDMITWKSVAQKLLLNGVQKQGHWEPLSKNTAKKNTATKKNI